MADPYDDPYDLLTSPGLVSAFGTPGDPATLKGMLDKHQQAAAGREAQAQDVMGQQQAQTQKMMDLLDQTAARIREARSNRGTNLPMLALGASMMGPGDFGTQLGRGLRAMVPQIQMQRAADEETDLKLLGLDMQKTKLAQAPLEQRLAYIRAIQQGDMNAVRAIETQLAKAQSAAAKGPTGKMALAQRLIDDAAKEGKTLTMEGALAKLQELSERQPAELQLLAQYQKDTKNPNASLLDMKKDVKWNEAYARKTGEMTGTNRMGIETAEQNMNRATQTIDELLGDVEGKRWAVGSLLSNVPAMYGSKKADFIAKHDYLTKQVFATAIQDMRGLGALSEAEGIAISASKLNAARTQSKEAYDKALMDFRNTLVKSYDIARRNAGVSPARTDFGGGISPRSQPGPEGSSPSPPSQTGLKPQGFKDGAIADGPNGPIIFKNGAWGPYNGR